jgi:hypothetical protein
MSGFFLGTIPQLQPFFIRKEMPILISFEPVYCMQCFRFGEVPRVFAVFAEGQVRLCERSTKPMLYDVFGPSSHGYTFDSVSKR